MEHLGSDPAHGTASGGSNGQQNTTGKARENAGSRPGSRRRSPLRVLLAVLAGVLAVAGVASLAALLLEALSGGIIWPGFAAGAFYALPVAFLLMAGLVIDSIVRRRRG